MFAYQLKVFIFAFIHIHEKKSSTLVFFLQHDASCNVIPYTIVFKMEFFFLEKSRNIYLNLWTLLAKN